MYEPIITSKCEEFGKTIVEPEELIKIVKSSERY